MDLVQESETKLYEDDLVYKLSEFGLSVDESSLFYLLTRVKKSGIDWISGKELAKIAKKDRVRVYQILQKLVKLGLIRADFGRPTGYSPVSPEAAIERLVSVHEARLRQLNSYEPELMEALRSAEPIKVSLESNGEEEENKPAIAMFHGVSGIQHLIRGSINGNSLRIIANEDSVDYLLTTVDRALEKPKSCKLILSGNKAAESKTSLQLSSTNGINIEISYLPGHLPSFVLTDNQVLILFYSVEKYKPRQLSSPKSRINMLHALVVTDKNYVEEMHQLFGTLWERSYQHGRILSAGSLSK